MRTTDKERPEQILIYLAKGYTKKLDRIKEERGFQSRPQVVEMLIDLFYTENSLKLQKTKMLCEIEVKKEEINTLKENIISVEAEMKQIALKLEYKEEKFQESINQTIEEVNAKIKEKSLSKEQIILHIKKVCIIRHIPFDLIVNKVNFISDKLSCI